MSDTKLFIPKPTIDAIMDLPIERVIGEYVPKLKRSGSNLYACCPFHHEKTASFSVSPAKRMFKCFGCGEGGNVIQFVMKHESLPFPEAAQKIAIAHNIPIDAPKDNVRKRDIKAADIGQTVKEFDFVKLPLNNEALKGIISRSVWRPDGANFETLGTDEKVQALDARYDKIIAVCKEYGLHALAEYSFVKEEEDGKHSLITIKSTPGMPVFMFECE